MRKKRNGETDSNITASSSSAAGETLNRHPLMVNAQRKFNWDDDDVEIRLNWFYLGSANLSPSAW